MGLPAESAGWDNVLRGLLGAFDKADVLMLGEAHGRKVDSELRLRLVRHPDFPNRARFIVAETLAPVATGRTGPEFDALDRALQSLERTLESPERPVRVLLKSKPAAAKLIANPFYLGQAMLPPDVTIGDSDDAVVYFGRSADAGAFVR